MIAHISHIVEQQSSSFSFVYYLVIRSCRCRCSYCSRRRRRHRHRHRHRQGCCHSFPLVTTIEPQFVNMRACVYAYEITVQNTIGKRAAVQMSSSCVSIKPEIVFPKFSNALVVSWDAVGF